MSSTGTGVVVVDVVVVEVVEVVVVVDVVVVVVVDVVVVVVVVDVVVDVVVVVVGVVVDVVVVVVVVGVVDDVVVDVVDVVDVVEVVGPNREGSGSLLPAGGGSAAAASTKGVVQRGARNIAVATTPLPRARAFKASRRPRGSRVSFLPSSFAMVRPCWAEVSMSSYGSE